MSEGMGRATKIGVAVVAAAVVVVAVALVVVLSGRPPEGPVPIAWDDEACAECHMHVGEPAFAAQLQTTDGRVLNFDDPGCLLRYVEANHPPVHAIYYHHVREDRWIPAERAAFVDVDRTPMGYGLGAVDRGTAGAISIEAATERVSERHAEGTATP